MLKISIDVMLLKYWIKSGYWSLQPIARINTKHTIACYDYLNVMVTAIKKKKSSHKDKSIELHTINYSDTF